VLAVLHAIPATDSRLGAAPAAAGSQARGQAAQAPTFSSTVTLVPVDVRVMDRRTGRPITDLKQEDFTIAEDGAPQEIRLFIQQSLEAEAPLPAKAGAAPVAGLQPAIRQGGSALAPQRARIFLFVLGSGRLHGGPVKGLDAAIDFIRHRLLPQDFVAAFGYNRATDFTTDHEVIAKVVERFRAENDAITSTVLQHVSGLGGVYGSRGMPPAVQGRIDGVFAGPRAMPFTRTAGAESAQSGDRLRADMRKQEEAAFDAAVAAGRVGPQSDSGGVAALPSIDWSGFDQFAATSALTMEDLGNLYAAIAYMQKLEGEKHLVFITESGLRLPRGDDFSDFARVAASGRVAVDIVQTGEAFDVTSNGWLRGISEDTGGLAAIAKDGSEAFNRLDLMTRNGYLLGYYPRNANWDGKERRVTVKVKRANATVVYRRGYLAYPGGREFDRRAYLTRFRLAAAMDRNADLADIKVTLAAAAATIDGAPAVDIDATVDVSALRFGVRDGVRLGRIDFAVVPLDGRGQMVGRTYKKQAAHLEYNEMAFALVQKLGVPYQVQMRVPAGTRAIRLIVYDCAADLLGSASARLK
jgi:VWFA-related protein